MLLAINSKWYSKSKGCEIESGTKTSKHNCTTYIIYIKKINEDEKKYTERQTTGNTHRP